MEQQQRRASTISRPGPPHCGYLLAEDVKAATSILDVISRHVRLKKQGKEWAGLCPFHAEKTPSFKVNSEKQLWRCWGCGAGGDVFSFVQKIENLSFPAAVRRLAVVAGLPDSPPEHLQSPQLELAGVELRAFDHWLYLKRKRLIARQAAIDDREATVRHAAEQCFGAEEIPADQIAAIHQTLTFCHVASDAIEELIRLIEQKPSEFVQEFLRDFYGNQDLREVLS